MGAAVETGNTTGATVLRGAQTQLQSLLREMDPEERAKPPTAPTQDDTFVDSATRPSLRVPR